MKNLMNPAAAPPLPQHDSSEAIEGQLALRLTSHLTRAAEDLPHDIGERLRFGRERAVALAQQSRKRAAAPSPAQVVVANGQHVAALGGPPSVWLRVASALPLLLLLVGLVMIQQHHVGQQIAVAAEIDSALLADELPPAAYGDAGFSEFLRTVAAP